MSNGPLHPPSRKREGSLGVNKPFVDIRTAACSPDEEEDLPRPSTVSLSQPPRNQQQVPYAKSAERQSTQDQGTSRPWRWCHNGVPVRLLLLGTTFVSTAMSLIAGLLLYSTSIDSLHNTVDEVSAADVGALRLALSLSFEEVERSAEVYVSMLRGRSNFTGLVDMADYFHWSAFATCKHSQNLYALGVKLVPKNDTPNNPNALWQEVWFDLLASGEREWVSGRYLPEDWTEEHNATCGSKIVDKPGHCVDVYKLDPATGVKTEPAYNFTHKYKVHQPGPHWDIPSIWQASDDNPYLYMGYGLVPVPELTLLPGTQTIIVSYMVFAAWQDQLSTYKAHQTTLIATQLDAGRNSQVLALSTRQELMKPGCSREQGAEYAYGGKPNPCSVVIGELGQVEQAAAVFLNKSTPDSFIRGRTPNGDHFMRRTMVFDPTAKPGRESAPAIWLLWVRAVSTIDEEVNHALINLIVFFVAIVVFDCVMAVLEVLLVGRPMKDLTHAAAEIECMDLDAGLRVLLRTSTKVQEVSRLVRGFQSMIDALKEYKKYLPDSLVQTENTSVDSCTGSPTAIAAGQGSEVSTPEGALPHWLRMDLSPVPPRSGALPPAVVPGGNAVVNDDGGVHDNTPSRRVGGPIGLGPRRRPPRHLGLRWRVKGITAFRIIGRPLDRPSPQIAVSVSTAAGTLLPCVFGAVEQCGGMLVRFDAVFSLAAFPTAEIAVRAAVSVSGLCAGQGAAAPPPAGAAAGKSPVGAPRLGDGWFAVAAVTYGPCLTGAVGGSARRAIAVNADPVDKAVLASVHGTSHTPVRLSDTALKQVSPEIFNAAPGSWFQCGAGLNVRWRRDVADGMEADARRAPADGDPNAACNGAGPLPAVTSAPVVADLPLAGLAGASNITLPQDSAAPHRTEQPESGNINIPGIRKEADSQPSSTQESSPSRELDLRKHLGVNAVPEPPSILRDSDSQASPCPPAFLANSLSHTYNGPVSTSQSRCSMPFSGNRGGELSTRDSRNGDEGSESDWAMDDRISTVSSHLSLSVEARIARMLQKEHSRREEVEEAELREYGCHAVWQTMLRQMLRVNSLMPPCGRAPRVASDPPTDSETDTRYTGSPQDGMQSHGTLGMQGLRRPDMTGLASPKMGIPACRSVHSQVSMQPPPPPPPLNTPNTSVSDESDKARKKALEEQLMQSVPTAMPSAGPQHAILMEAAPLQAAPLQVVPQQSSGSTVAQAPGPPPPASHLMGSASDSLSRLRTLHELHQRGVLPREAYDAEVTRALSA